MATRANVLKPRPAGRKAAEPLRRVEVHVQHVVVWHKIVFWVVTFLLALLGYHR